MEEKLVSGLFSTTDPALHLGVSSGRRELDVLPEIREKGHWDQAKLPKPYCLYLYFWNVTSIKTSGMSFKNSHLTEGGIIIPVGRAAAFLVGPFRALHVRVVAVVGTVIAGRGVMLENRTKKLGILRESSSFHKYNEHKSDKFTLCLLS